MYVLTSTYVGSQVFDSVRLTTTSDDKLHEACTHGSHRIKHFYISKLFLILLFLGAFRRRSWSWTVCSASTILSRKRNIQYQFWPLKTAGRSPTVRWLLARCTIPWRVVLTYRWRSTAIKWRLIREMENYFGNMTRTLITSRFVSVHVTRGRPFVSSLFSVGHHNRCDNGFQNSSPRCEWQHGAAGSPPMIPTL